MVEFRLSKPDMDAALSAESKKVLDKMLDRWVGKSMKKHERILMEACITGQSLYCWLDSNLELVYSLTPNERKS